MRVSITVLGESVNTECWVRVSIRVLGESVNKSAG